MKKANEISRNFYVLILLDAVSQSLQAVLNMLRQRRFVAGLCSATWDKLPMWLKLLSS